MKIVKMAGVAATVVTLGLAGVTAAPAWATDSVRVFGEQETLNGPNGLPYIGYTVGKLKPSSDPVPHNGKLYAAKLTVDGFGGSYPPFIERFGARAESGDFYPSIWGASNPGKLYFDVVGDVPNSVVYNDGIRDLLAWVPGQPGSTAAPVVVPDEDENFQVVPDNQATAGAPTTPGNSSIVATPNDLASPPYQITEGEAAQPGFNAGGGHR
ncbi:DUF1942 domain-containing protein [Mycobacterium sp. EPa45]|uniref:DUF1942 domain-containing protein n=1 Tax=Mycobacterium sp. EPa45 TaxID=1545728 RepID=UPI000641CCCF|nr:DUF1942 domain-containing protein [Mycobacterium sp. EPa45]AKK27069.1 hypothetical protein AB431_10715 [Mycobacterium sp. EPa45]